MGETWLPHPGCSCTRVGGSEDHLCLLLSNVLLFPSPSRTCVQGDGIYGLANRARPPIAEPATQPHVPSCLSHLRSRLGEASGAPHLGHQRGGGNTRLAGLLPALMAMGVPALPSTRSGPQHQPCPPFPHQSWCERRQPPARGCTHAVSPEPALPARLLSPAWAHVGWLGEMRQGRECLRSANFPWFRQTGKS